MWVWNVYWFWLRIKPRGRCGRNEPNKPSPPALPRPVQLLVDHSPFRIVHTLSQVKLHHVNSDNTWIITYIVFWHGHKPGEYWWRPNEGFSVKKFSFCEAPPRNIEVVGGCFLRGPSYYEASSLEKKKKCSSKTLLFQTKMVKFFTTMGVAQLAVICSIIFKGIFLRIFEDVRQIYYLKY